MSIYAFRDLLPVPDHPKVFMLSFLGRDGRMQLIGFTYKNFASFADVMWERRL